MRLIRMLFDLASERCAIRAILKRRLKRQRKKRGLWRRSSEG